MAPAPVSADRKSCPHRLFSENAGYKNSMHGRPGVPGGSDGKESACNVGGLGSTPGSGRSFGEGNGSPLLCSELENAMDRGARWAALHGAAKTWM